MNVRLATGIRVAPSAKAQPKQSDSDQFPFALTTERLKNRVANLFGHKDHDPVISPGSRRGEYTFELTIYERGVISLSVYICNGDELNQCIPSNGTMAPLTVVGGGIANPLIFTVCNSNVSAITALKPLG